MIIMTNRDVMNYNKTTHFVVDSIYYSCEYLQYSSYRPPPEFIFDEEEKLKWESEEPEDRRVNFMPESFPNLRTVPAYSHFLKERFERCLDLYLAPRQRKMKMNVNKEDLIPKLPSPKDLQPFPTFQGRFSVVYFRS